MNQVQWLTHQFTVFEAQSVTWNDIGGIYIFCVLRQNQWIPLYIGKADSFSNRLANHERWEEARRLGATHIHAMVVEQEGTRLLVERELIQRFDPQLNVQHRR